MPAQVGIRASSHARPMERRDQVNWCNIGGEHRHMAFQAGVGNDTVSFGRQVVVRHGSAPRSFEQQIRNGQFRAAQMHAR